MASRTITIPSAQITANVEAHSASAALLASVHSVTVQLNDTDGQWGTTTGNIKKWGVQYSTDGGVNWNWGPVFQGDLVDSTRWIPFGSLGKNGLPPFLAISGDALVSLVNDQLRLAVLTDANIRMGATIVATT